MLSIKTCCELPRPEGRGFQRSAGLFASSLICWFGGLTAPSITMRAMFMFAFCKKAFLTFLAILAVNGEVFSYNFLRGVGQMPFPHSSVIPLPHPPLHK